MADLKRFRITLIDNENGGFDIVSEVDDPYMEGPIPYEDILNDSSLAGHVFLALYELACNLQDDEISTSRFLPDEKQEDLDELAIQLARAMGKHDGELN